MAETTASGYIQHHLQNLTFGQLPNGGWGFAHSAAEAKELAGRQPGRVRVALITCLARVPVV